MVHIRRLLIFFAVATLAWAAAVFSASPGTDAEHNTPEEFLLSASGQASCPSPKFGLRSKRHHSCCSYSVFPSVARAFGGGTA